VISKMVISKQKRARLFAIIDNPLHRVFSVN